MEVAEEKPITCICCGDVLTKEERQNLRCKACLDKLNVSKHTDLTIDW
jgi:uncharacterized paraquat-inducible protein A